MDRTLVVIGAVAGVAVAAVGGAAWFMPVPPPPPAAAPPAPVAAAPAPPEPSWVPAGFTEWPGQDVAFRWGKSEYRPGCREDTLCLPVEVIARAGCDSLYVAASMLDAAGRNIGFTNDTTSGVGAGETAVLAMNASEGATQSMRITEINCR